MSITTGDILRVVAVMVWDDGEIMQNVYNAVVTGGGSPWSDSDIVDDALAWVDAMYTELESDISDTVSGSEVRVYVYDSVDDDWDEVGSNAWVFVGLADQEDELPRAVAALVNAKSSDPDVNGKKYIGGYTEGGSEDGLVKAATLARLILFAAEWGGIFTGSTSGADWGPGIWSVTRTNFFLMAATYLISTIWAYQRRRKRGVGI